MVDFSMITKRNNLIVFIFIFSFVNFAKSETITIIDEIEEELIISPDFVSPDYNTKWIG